MKILQIDKYNYLRGGAERYYLELSKLLQQHGHQVMVFSQQNEKNVSKDYAQYFPKEQYRFFWSGETAAALEDLLKVEKPDIAHIHLLYHHLTPSILKVLKRHHIPVVMTVHDYKLICPNYLLFTEGSPCERCKGHNYAQAVAHKCLQGSVTKSSIVALEMYWHKWFKTYERYIDWYIAPSQFAKTKLVEFGQPAENIQVIPHFIDLTGKQPNYNEGDYILYFGRLSAEKGVDKIIEVYYNKNVSVPLKIAGTGPLEKTLKQTVERYGLTDRIQFLGHLSDSELATAIQHSRFVLVPSLVWETFGLAALEAFAYGKAVVAHAAGALPEVVQHNQTGLIYQTDTELAEQLMYAVDNPSKLIDLGKYARTIAEQNYDPQQHYAAIMAVYRRFSAAA